MDIHHIMEKIKDLLHVEKNIPPSMLQFAFWMSKHLTQEELMFLDGVDPKYGNQLLVRAMVDSGRYVQDGETVQAIL